MLKSAMKGQGKQEKKKASIVYSRVSLIVTPPIVISAQECSLSELCFQLSHDTDNPSLIENFDCLPMDC